MSEVLPEPIPAVTAGSVVVDAGAVAAPAAPCVCPEPGPSRASRVKAVLRHAGREVVRVVHEPAVDRGLKKAAPAVVARLLVAAGAAPQLVQWVEQALKASGV